MRMRSFLGSGPRRAPIRQMDQIRPLRSDRRAAHPGAAKQTPTAMASLAEKARRTYYQYEVMSSLYLLEPWERRILSTRR